MSQEFDSPCPHKNKEHKVTALGNYVFVAGQGGSKGADGEAVL